MALAALLGAGASLAGGLFGSSSSKNAAKQQAKSAQAAIDEQRRQFDVTRSDMEPFREVGTASLGKLADMLGIKYGNAPVAPNSADFTTTEPGYWTEPKDIIQGRGGIGRTIPGRFVAGKTLFNDAGYNSAMDEYERLKAEYDAQEPSGSLLDEFTGDDLVNDPGYQFQLEQGEKAIERGAAARGNRYSPATVKELLRFNTGLNDTTFNNAFNRDRAYKQDTFGMLSGTTGTGSNAASTIGQIGANTSANIGNTMMSAGNAQAAGTVGSANAITSGVGNALNFWNQYNWMKPQNTASTVPYNTGPNDNLNSILGFAR